MINNTLTKSRSFSIVVLSLIVLALFCPVSADYLEEVGTCHLPRSMEGAIWVEGDYAYVAGGFTFDLAIIDIADPANPLLMSTLDSLFRSEDVVVSGDYAYMAWSVGGLATVNISDPFNPAVVSVIQTHQYAHNLVVRDSLIYLANCARGLRIFDVSDPSNPDSLGKFDSLYADEANGIEVIGNTAYLTEWYGGLWILDISNPLMPAFVGNYPTRNVRTRDIKVSGHYAYLLSDILAALTVVDISSPSDPFFARTYQLGGDARHLALQDNYLLVAHDSVTIFDISQAPDLTVAAAYGRAGSHGFEDMAIEGDLVYAIADTSMTILRFVQTNIEDKPTLPARGSLSCYPNPFNSSAVLTLDNPRAADIGIYDISGRLLARLKMENGRAIWEASGVSSGIYFARLESGSRSESLRLVLQK